MTLPENWLHFTLARPEYVITRDGLRLERITISVIKLGEDLPDTDRVYRADMLPHEVAELSLGLVESGEEIGNFQVERIERANVAGHDGYKACAVFTDTAGLCKRLYLCGAIVRDHVCEFRYEAADKVYSGRFLGVFERLVASARSL